MSAAPQHDFDLIELRALATADLDAFVTGLKGPPNNALSSRRTWRYGTKGSLKIEMSGRKRGLWVNFEGGGGDVFDLVRHERGGTFGDAVRYLAERYGSGAAYVTPRPTLVRPIEPDPDEQAEHARKIRQARDMAHAAGPITETIAETYLVEVRKCSRPASGWPDAIRFHVATRSLLVVATLADGSNSAVQRVRLTPNGRKAEGTAEHPTKITNGRLEGALVRLPAWRTYGSDEAPPLLIAEAPETAIAIWSATGHEMHFLLGISSLPKVTLPTNRRVAYCRDDDPRESPADKTVRKALTGWKTAGADVVVATPWPTRQHNKSDFADTIKANGPHAVARRVEMALSPPDPFGGGVPVDEARTETDEKVGAFIQAAEQFDPKAAEAAGELPPVHAVRVPVGVGKSHAARQHTAALLARMRARGDKRAIAIAVPTHRLGSEQQQIFREMPGTDLAAEVWRGRNADDPENPGEKMCLDLEAVEDASSVGLDPQTAVCRLRRRGEEERACPHFAICAYQRQRKRKADVWIMPHELLFNERPTAMGDLAAVVVDEAAWQDGLEGQAVRIDNGVVKHSAALTLSLDALTGSDRRIGDDRNPDWLVLQDCRARSFNVLRHLEDGPICRDSFDGTLTADDCVDARQLEFTRKVDPGLWPGMPRADRRAAVKGAEDNRVMLLRARLWRALAALLADDGPQSSGWASLATIDGENGPQRVVHLKGRHDVRTGWKVPTLLIDALLDVELVKPFWPQVRLVANIETSAPHQRIRQVTDRAFAKSRLNPLDADAAEAKPDVARARLRHLREVRDIVTREARRWPTGRVLLVAQKGAKEGLIDMGLPPNVETGHHNAIAGMDVWRDVQQLIVVGRTMPRASSVERMAEALTGTAIEPVEDYDRASGVRVTAGRGPVPCETVRHPHPVAEAIRWQVCEGELVQIIGRGRGVNRTAAEPLDVLVLTDPPLPMVIDEEISAADLAPSLTDRMLGASGVAFENPGHASDAYPELWSNREAAKKAFSREKLGTISKEYISPKGLSPTSPPLRRIDYQREGQGQSPAVAWFDPLLCPDPETWLTERLGSLAWCCVGGPQTDPEPPRESPAGEAEEPRQTPDAPNHPEPVANIPGAAPDGFAGDMKHEAPPIDPGEVYPAAGDDSDLPPAIILTTREPGLGAGSKRDGPAASDITETNQPNPESNK